MIQENGMKIFIWRHSKFLSSWSMFDEPHICRENYMQAEVVILANSEEEALELLNEDQTWNLDELKRIQPIVHELNEPFVISKSVCSG